MTQIDKTSVQDGLKSLIEQTYLIEREYKNLTASYASLQDFIKDIVEILPNAIWVLDEAGEIFLQNSEALKLGQILKFIPQNEGEISAAGQIYLIKIAQKEGKKIISATDITTEKRTERSPRSRADAKGDLARRAHHQGHLAFHQRSHDKRARI